MSLPQYPYTNMSDTNLDWLISTVKQLEKYLTGKFDDVLKNIIYEKFNTLFANTAYDEDNHRLILTLETIEVADGEHIYDANNESMTII